MTDRLPPEAQAYLDRLQETALATMTPEDVERWHAIKREAAEIASLRELVAGTIESERLAAGMSIEQLAAAAGVEVYDLERIEERHWTPDIATLTRLARVLGIAFVFPPEAEEERTVRLLNEQAILDRVHVRSRSHD